jgi:hypothetical protein
MRTFLGVYLRRRSQVEFLAMSNPSGMGNKAVMLKNPTQGRKITCIFEITVVIP